MNTLKYRQFLETVGSQGLFDPRVGQFRINDGFFEEDVENTKIFVFKDAPNDAVTVVTEENRYIQVGKDGEQEIQTYDSLKLHLPFESCWFEVIGNDQTIMRAVVPIGGAPRKLFVCGVLVREAMPGQFTYYILLEKREDNQVGRLVVYFDERLDSIQAPGLPEKHYNKEDETFRNIAIESIRPLLKQLLASATGITSVNEKFKVKNGKRKHFPKIRRIIYVVPKKERGLAIPGESREVDWSHRWEVRGHWRKLHDVKSLGKNRNGDYEVIGYTWVDPHVKGPEDLPLITDKVRIIKPTEEEEPKNGTNDM